MEDKGRYGCTANNSAGFQRHEAYLEVASMPDFHLYLFRIMKENFCFLYSLIQSRGKSEKSMCFPASEMQLKEKKT